MSSPTIQIKLELEPIINHDAESGFYCAHFKAFPQAVAYDETEHKALLRLFELFQVMLVNEKTEIIEQLIHDQNVSLDLLKGVPA